MEPDFVYLNRIHTKVRILPTDLIVTPSLYYELEVYQNDLYTYCLNINNYDSKMQKKIKNHKEFLKLKYEMVFDW